MNTNSEKWALIPSDPAVFDDMIQQYGIEDTQVQEVLVLDYLDDYKDNTSVYGLIFISEYMEEVLPANFEQTDPLASDIVFTAQVVTNVCATLALLAVLLNANIDKGNILNNFLQFTEGFSPINRGLCLGSCREIRAIHDAYASNAYHLAEGAMDETTENDNSGYEYVDSNNYHYITYIYKNGFVWELDGLKSQPLRLQQCTHQKWINAVKPFIQQRMQQQEGGLYNLMAVVKDTYNTKLKRKNAYDSYLKLSNELAKKKLAQSTLIRRRKAMFNIMQDADVQYHDIMKDIWNTIYQRDYISAEIKMDAFAMEIDPFNQEVEQLTIEKEKAKGNATRQKFDYFPFLQSLFTAGFQHKILHDTSKPTKRKSAKETATKIPVNDTSKSMKRKTTKKAMAKIS
ncbi:unnamed protein product [Mucor circinelloides]